MKFSKYITLYVLSIVLVSTSLIAQNKKKSDLENKKDTSSIYSGLKFRSIGPALMSAWTTVLPLSEGPKTSSFLP